MYTRDDISINRLQGAAAHFLLVSLYVNCLCLQGNATVAFSPAAFISPVFPVCFKIHGLLGLLQLNLQTGLSNLCDFDINKVAFCLEKFEKWCT